MVDLLAYRDAMISAAQVRLTGRPAPIALLDGFARAFGCSYDQMSSDYLRRLPPAEPHLSATAPPAAR